MIHPRILRFKETERTALASPQSYVSLVNKELQPQITSLSLFPIGILSMAKGEFTKAISVFENAILASTQNSDTEPTQG